jgi:hypothetical protein
LCCIEINKIFLKHFSDKTEKVLGVLKEKLNEILHLSPSEPASTPNISVTKNFWYTDDEDDEVHESQNLLGSYFSAEKNLGFVNEQEFQKHLNFGQKIQHCAPE